MAKKNLFSGGGNPFLNERNMREAATSNTLDGDFIQVREKMTVQGAINKSFILFAIMLVTAAIAFVNPSQLFLYGGMFGGLAVLIFASFKKHLSPTLAPLYAALEGFFVGAVTSMYAYAFGNGIIFSAVSLTVALLFAMLFIYKTEIIKVTSKFRMGVVMATAGIMIVYLLTWVLSFFGIQMPFIHDTGLLGIGISLFVIVIACMNLLLDFDNFERGEQYGAPKYYEWYSAMGLLVTLVWLYVELLRLLSKLSSD